MPSLDVPVAQRHRLPLDLGIKQNRGRTESPDNLNNFKGWSDTARGGRGKMALAGHKKLNAAQYFA